MMYDFDKPITNFDDFDLVMKMNLLKSAQNLCKNMYENDVISCSDYDDCKDNIAYCIEMLDNELDG